MDTAADPRSGRDGGYHTVSGDRSSTFGGDPEDMVADGDLRDMVADVCPDSAQRRQTDLSRDPGRMAGTRPGQQMSGNMSR